MRTEIDGVIIRELKRRVDARGWLMELFRRDEIPDDLRPAMGYVSLTHPGIARGPHEHRLQTDLFCFLGPSTFRLYLWDNRPGSTTSGTRFRAEFGPDAPVIVMVPPGVVHAYKNIGDVDGLVFNAPNRLYGGEGRRGTVDEIRYENDPRSPFRID